MSYTKTQVSKYQNDLGLEGLCYLFKVKEITGNPLASSQGWRIFMYAIKNNIPESEVRKFTNELIKNYKSEDFQDVKLSYRLELELRKLHWDKHKQKRKKRNENSRVWIY